MSDQLHASSALSRGTSHWSGDWVGPRAVSTLWRLEISYSCRESNYNPLAFQPIHSDCIEWGNPASWAWACCRGSLLNTYLLTYLLTYSMEQGPSWDASWFSASQELSRILCNSKVHYHIHKCPAPVIILSQIDPVHVSHPTCWISILISFHLRQGFPSGLFPSGFPTKILYVPLLSPHACYMPRPSHSRFDHPNNI